MNIHAGAAYLCLRLLKRRAMDVPRATPKNLMRQERLLRCEKAGPREEESGRFFEKKLRKKLGAGLDKGLLLDLDTNE
jgi:hypothetical protein